MIRLDDRAALLLDLDGTLIDIAPTPDAVVVPASLPPDLRALRARLGGALAIVTGRTVAVVDALLGDVATAVAGEHGAAIRHQPGAAPDRVPARPVPEAWIAAGEAAIAAHPGALLERKQAGFVLHFRLAPDAGPALRQAAEAIAGPGFTVMAAKMAWEIKPAGIDKGGAVRAIMARLPFAGRVPVYIGDDTTDEAAIVAAQALGGRGYRVAETFGDPAGVRAWLGRAAGKNKLPF